MSSQGELVGFGDSFCFEDNLGSANGSFAVDCGRDEFCLTDMRVNWTPQGDQEATITRRCAKENQFHLTVTIRGGFLQPKGKNFTRNVFTNFHAFPFLVW